MVSFRHAPNLYQNKIIYIFLSWKERTVINILGANVLDHHVFVLEKDRRKNKFKISEFLCNLKNALCFSLINSFNGFCRNGLWRSEAKSCDRKDQGYGLQVIYRPRNVPLQCFHDTIFRVIGKLQKRSSTKELNLLFFVNYLDK